MHSLVRVGRAPLFFSSHLIYNDIAEPARIVLHPQPNVTVLADQTVQLVCAASGAPTPDRIVWSNSTGPILNDSSCIDSCKRQYSRVVTINNTILLFSVLELCSVRTTDSEEYRCTAGNSNFSVSVIVSSPSPSPTPSPAGTY